ncbi:MAG TPA: zinc-binding alcohol dehydrogenase [Polyangiaceae bacterium]|jgi:threonine dehydrogenase-like Zn-dependent dehydrogenase
MTDLGGKPRAFWTTGVGVGEIRAEFVPAPGPGELRVQTLYSAVSRGTESLVFQGHVPESEFSRMRCPHQAGDFPAPVKYGYSSVGRVVAGGGELEGRLVFCLYPHQSEYVVGASALLPLPDDVPSGRAVLAANMESAVNAIWDLNPRLGDRITVIGAGVLGCLCAYLLRQQAAVDVELVDLLAGRASVAAALGVRFRAPERASGSRDLVVHASASEAGLQRALGLLAPEGTLLELSWYGDASPSVPLGRDFHVNRLNLRSSQVGRVSPNARARFGNRERLELALSLCRDSALDSLIDGESPFESLPEVLRELSAQSGALCRRIRYASAS